MVVCKQIADTLQEPSGLIAEPCTALIGQATYASKQCQQPKLQSYPILVELFAVTERLTHGFVQLAVSLAHLLSLRNRQETMEIEVPDRKIAAVSLQLRHQPARPLVKHSSIPAPN